MLLNFTDEELEKGIEELEGEFADRHVLKFDLTMQGVIVTNHDQSRLLVCMSDTN